jgi:CheY-specific phosphatase CheX
MNAVQVNEVHKLQATKDQKFGQIAIEEGYLTEEKLDDLLKAQNKSNVLLGQALIEKGYFTFDQYEEVLCQYNAESGFNSDEITALKNNDVQKIVKKYLNAVNKSDGDLVHDYFELFIRNLVRFIDDEIGLEEAKEIDSYTFSHLITQKIIGKYNLITSFTGSESTLARFASIYSGEKLCGMEAMAKDSLGEFLNCQNGLFLTNLSHRGIELDLSPQEVRENGTLKSQKNMYLVPCYLSFGKIDFIFSNESSIDN